MKRTSPQPTAKALLLLATGLLAMAGATAQPQSLIPPPHDAEAAISKAIGTTTLAKGTGIGSRVFSYTYYLSNTAGIAQPNDSQRVKYPSNTTDKWTQILQFNYANNTWKPNNRTDYTYNNQSTVSYSGMAGSVWNTATSTYDSSWKTIYTFNSAGYPIVSLGKSWNAATQTYVTSSQGLYTRNAANKVMDMTFQNWTNNAWVNTNRTTFTRNAQGNVLVESAANWNGNAWVNDRRYTNTYDNTGLHMTHQTLHMWDAQLAAWVPNSDYIYTLNSAGYNAKLYSFAWNTATAAWDSIGRTTYTYDAQNNETQQILEIKNGTPLMFRNFVRMSSTYNSYNQPLVATQNFWVNGAWVFTSNNTGTCVVYKNYYEPYTTTGIGGSIVPTGAALQAYPIPATTGLHIGVDWDEAQAFSATLSDMAGRVYQRFSAPAAKAFSTTLSVSDMPAGNYLLSISGSKGGGASRMITVAH